LFSPMFNFFFFSSYNFSECVVSKIHLLSVTGNNLKR
jgi:hypothetical protein